MSKDLDPIVEEWPAVSGGIRVRHVVGDDGRDFLQLRVDLGVLQMTFDGRPDGLRPHACDSVLDHLRDRIARSPAGLTLADDDREAIERETMQYYRRRIGLMALAEQAKGEEDVDLADGLYHRAIRDADHNLAIIELLEAQDRDRGFVAEHVQYRPFILMHRATCLAERALLVDDADQAIEQLKSGTDAIETCLESEDEPDESDESDEADEAAALGVDTRAFAEALRLFERRIRKKYRRRRTLREQLDDAIEAEDYEQAARIRDQLEGREAPPTT